MQFKKSEYIKRTSMEMVDNCVEMLKQIKNVNSAKMHAPLPKRSDSLNAEMEHADMNI